MAPTETCAVSGKPRFFAANAFPDMSAFPWQLVEIFLSSVHVFVHDQI